MNEQIQQGSAGIRTMTAAEFRNRVADVVGLATDHMTGVSRQARDYARGNPWQAAGLLALVGLAAGFLITRGTRRGGLRTSDGAAPASPHTSRA